MRGRLLVAIIFVLLVLGIVVWPYIQIRRTISDTEVLIQDLNKQTQQLTGEILQLIDEETKWIGSGPVEYLTFDPDGTPVVWRVSIFYTSSDGRLTKGEHIVFGESVMKAFGLFSEHGLEGHWIQVKKDDVWHTVETEEPDMSFVRSTDGKVVGVGIVLRDEKGNEIVRRFVGRN